jgi:Cellulase (glycosyl hydrolase family 5)
VSETPAGSPGSSGRGGTRLTAPVPRVAAILLLALLAAALPARAAHASATQVMTFEAPRELLDDSTRDATLDEIKAFGVDRVRALVYWRQFAPRPTSRRKPGFDASNPDAYPAGTWDRLDRLLAATEARGMTVQLTLTGPVPKWATRARRDYRTNPVPKLFGQWVTAVARRYGARVNLWSVWNEPNQPQFLRPQFKQGRPASPALYRKLYVAAEKALHGVPGGARDTVLFGETSPVGNVHIVAPLAFLRGALCLDAQYHKRAGCSRLRTDGYAHHAYTKRRGPTYRSADLDEVNIATLDRLVRALSRAVRARAITSGGRDIYLTEYGIQSVPDTIAGVSLSRQAEYMAISERIAYANPSVKAFSQYLMRDDAPRKNAPRGERYSGFETGLKRHDGKAKPSYRGFAVPLAVSAYGSSDVLWGRVRPARGVTDVTIEYKRRGKAWRRLTATRTNAQGIFGLRSDHRDGQHYRIRWTRPDGSTLVGPPIRAY